MKNSCSVDSSFWILCYLVLSRAYQDASQLKCDYPRSRNEQRTGISCKLQPQRFLVSSCLLHLPQFANLTSLVAQRSLECLFELYWFLVQWFRIQLLLAKYTFLWQCCLQQGSVRPDSHIQKQFKTQLQDRTKSKVDLPRLSPDQFSRPQFMAPELAYVGLLPSILIPSWMHSTFCRQQPMRISLILPRMGSAMSGFVHVGSLIFLGYISSPSTIFTCGSFTGRS